MAEPMSDTRILQKPRKTKETKSKKKNQKGRTYVPVSGMGPVLLVFLFFLVFRGFWILRHGFCHFVFFFVFFGFSRFLDTGTWVLSFCFFVFFGFSKFLIPLSRENRVICMARDGGCTSDTGMYSSADGCIYGLCWPENSEKTALSQCPVLFFFGKNVKLLLSFKLLVFLYKTVFENKATRPVLFFCLSMVF